MKVVRGLEGFTWPVKSPGCGHWVHARDEGRRRVAREKKLVVFILELGKGKLGRDKLRERE